MVPTGQPIEYQAARLFTFRGDLIAHEQRIYDFGGVLERLDKLRTDHELATAAVVQHMLMARTDMAGEFFEVARVSVPCRAITGDFLEYHHVPSVAFGLALGDVSGKGPPAALVAAMLNGMLAMVPDGMTAPDALLERLNVGLCQRNISRHYATLSYAVLTADRRLTYANAGHPPPLLVTAGGVRPLTAGGPMLGLLDVATYPCETLQVAPGDSLILYSDGVSEALAPNGEEFGVERLMAAAAEHAAAHPTALVEALLAAVRVFADGAPSVDDATIAVLRVQ
jgi:sigma-B regulation protein RsbU (phosphoserine phosphatase)